jgi:hypothetical protein
MPPLYTYKCPECEKVEDAYRSINDRNNGPECHGQMQKIIIPTAIQPVLGGGNMPGYQCSVTGEFVTSRKRRKEIMREHNLYEKG